MKSLTPNIFTHNIAETLTFYHKLGFEKTMSVPTEGTDLQWVMMTNGSVSLMFQTFASLGQELPDVSRSRGGSLLLYIQVPDIQALFDSVKNRVHIVKALEKTFYGATEFSVMDNNGYVLTFAQDA